MTTNEIRRAHDDPKWSGRYVEGADNGWKYDECTTDHLLGHLSMAASVVRRIPRNAETFPAEWDGHGVLKTKHVEELALVFELVDNLQRYLPWVEGWCVMEQLKNPGFEEIVSAHTTEEDAFKWMLAWADALPPFPPRDLRMYSIRFQPAPILMFRHPDAHPRTFIQREHANDF